MIDGRELTPISAMVGRWGGASLIKSAQRGTISIVGSATQTATITAVDPTNTILLWNGFYNGTYNDRNMLPYVELTNSTTITATRTSTYADGGTIVAYDVLEFFPGFIKSIQSGVTTMTSGTTNATITAVNLAKTLSAKLGWRSNDSGLPVTYIDQTVQLTSATNLQIVTAGFSSWQISWRVVEFY